MPILKRIAHCLAIYICFSVSLPSLLAAKELRVEEQQFIQSYSGKTRQFVAQALGEPHRKEHPIKPNNTDQVIQDKVGQVGNNSEQIEMWYYQGKIQYAPNKFFNTAELTFANDKCVNITFANKK